MLTIVVGTEALNEETNEFVVLDAFSLHLEHSLVALSKWESIWEKAFLSTKDLSTEQMLSYVEAMIVNENYPADILSKLSEDNFRKIHEYMGSKQSATWFSDALPEAKSRETITSELIYYWMNACAIPFHPAETWHLQRLFNLIKIHSLKNSKPKKMSGNEMRQRRAELNAQRLRELGTTG